MIKVGIKNQSEDQAFRKVFEDLITSSPRYNVGWTLSEVGGVHDADRTYVLVDQPVENEDEWDTDEFFVSRDLLYSEPRDAIHKIIKYLPQLYCVNYEILEKNSH
jgi:hypothetical protein